ncbi:MAG: DUF1854 domain-containing protein [Planctomycetes bacterium]|nr:DUF1854 domain-containing protein [Planctomycetota bacterium]
MRSESGPNGRDTGPGFTLHHDAWGRLVLTDVSGREHAGVEPVRAFPLSSPRHGVSVCDAEGRELFWIDDLDDLPVSVRKVLEDELTRREFVPVLRRVLSVTAVEPSEWRVETDRGPTRFLLKSEDDVCPLDDHRALVTDANGIRYLIPDLRELDATSRRLLERFL